jgi:hypothetical protein
MNTNIFRIFALLTISFSLTAFLYAQNGQADLAERANQAFERNDWKGALPLYEQLTSEKPENQVAWMRLGIIKRRTNDPVSAITALKKAQQLKKSPVAAMEMVGAYLETKQPELAAAQFETIVANGFAGMKMVETDPAYPLMRSDPRIVKSLEQLRDATRPCANAAKRPQYREFDFWVGDWDVYAPNGTKAGTSKVEKILSGCVILENWTSVSAADGKSFNKYNPDLARWEQYWVGEGGDTTYFHGKLEGKNMVYTTDPIAGDNGISTVRRLTFFNLDPNTVRQFGEISQDGGKTFNTEYDLKYRRRASSKAEMGRDSQNGQ